MRTAYRTIGFYLMIRVGCKLLFKDAVFEFFADKLKWLLEETATDKNVQDAAFYLEINTILGMNIYLLRKCFYSFALESLAD